MAIEYTKEVQGFLEKFKGHSFNSKISKVYQEADDLSKKSILSPSPSDKEAIEHAVNKYNQKGSVFTKDSFILMELKSKILYFKLGLDRYCGQYGWKNFNSPTEVLAATIPLIVAKWDHRMVSFNVKNVLEPTNMYEVDQNWTFYGTSVFLLDVQGELPHERKELFDKQKYIYFNERTKYLQIKGVTVVNNYIGVCKLILKTIS